MRPHCSYNVAMKDTVVRARVDAELKARAVEALADNGLELSDAIRLFLVQVVRHRGLPFSVRDRSVKVASGKYLRAMKRKAQKQDHEIAARGEVPQEAFLLLRPENMEGMQLQWPSGSLLDE